MGDVMSTVEIGSVTLTKERSEHRIPAPAGVRPPLKANVFDFGAGICSQLQPMFPYENAGSIVPCVAVMQGTDDGNYGQFFHMNTVEEIALVYGSNNAMLATGSVFATQRIHGVNSFLKDPKDPEAYIVITITQHQSESNSQGEAILFRCEKCSHELVNFGYDATPRDVPGHDPTQWGGTLEDQVAMFPTLWGGVRAFVQFRDVAIRTCSECGHVNPEFPEKVWGWNRWTTQWKSVNAAKLAMIAAAAAAEIKNAPETEGTSSPGAEMVNR